MGEGMKERTIQMREVRPIRSRHCRYCWRRHRSVPSAQCSPKRGPVARGVIVQLTMIPRLPPLSIRTTIPGYDWDVTFHNTQFSVLEPDNQDARRGSRTPSISRLRPSTERGDRTGARRALDSSAERHLRMRSRLASMLGVGNLGLRREPLL